MSLERYSGVVSEANARESRPLLGYHAVFLIVTPPVIKLFTVAFDLTTWD